MFNPNGGLIKECKQKDAMKMLLTGDMINAKEAKRISLINDYVSESDLEDSVMNLALKIFKNP